MELENELIIGIHSIRAALENPKRNILRWVCTDEGLIDFNKKSSIKPKIKPEIVSSHYLQEMGKNIFLRHDWEFQRIPSGMFLETESLPVLDFDQFKNLITKKEKLKILALDQISDVHNGGAIFRTAAFYGIDIIILPDAKSFGMTPSFYRIASGATEFISLYRTNHLSRTLTQIQEMGVTLIGLSEHSENSLTSIDQSFEKIALILGAEDVGLSNAVKRQVQHLLQLKPQGQIKSLNVSTAAAIAMQICFANKQ